MEEAANHTYQGLTRTMLNQRPDYVPVYVMVETEGLPERITMYKNTVNGKIYDSPEQGEADDLFEIYEMCGDTYVQLWLWMRASNELYEHIKFEYQNYKLISVLEIHNLKKAFIILIGGAEQAKQCITSILNNSVLMDSDEIELPKITYDIKKYMIGYMSHCTNINERLTQLQLGDLPANLDEIYYYLNLFDQHIKYFSETVDSIML